MIGTNTKNLNDLKLSMPSVILSAGSAGVGKSTVFKDLVRAVPDMYWMDKDATLEMFLHSNPFILAKPDGTLEPDSRLSFSSPEYAKHFRDQVYAAMFNLGYENTKLDKSSVLDANYIGWLKDPKGRISLARRVANLYDSCGADFSSFRLPIVYFAVTEPEVVRQRITKRMENDPAAYDRDHAKVATSEAWAAQIAKEPVTPIPELDLYSDVCVVDLTQEYQHGSANARYQVQNKILDFLHEKKSLADTGVFKGESLEQTLAYFRK